VWLLRHAEVREDWQDVAYGDLDVPLSAAGEAETTAVGERFGALRPGAVIASPLARARRLGEAVATAGKAPLSVAEGLREGHRGDWQGRRFGELELERPDELRAYRDDPWTGHPHQGESDHALCARAWPVLEDLVRRHAGVTLVLTTHRQVIRVLLSRALGIPPSASFRLRIDPGAAALLVDGTPGWLLAHLNVGDPLTAMPEGTGVLDGMHFADAARVAR
jgi:broad specificity phosphatase PhoE